MESERINDIYLRRHYLSGDVTAVTLLATTDVGSETMDRRLLDSCGDMTIASGGDITGASIVTSITGEGSVTGEDSVTVDPTSLFGPGKGPKADDGGPATWRQKMALKHGRRILYRVHNRDDKYLI